MKRLLILIVLLIPLTLKSQNVIEMNQRDNAEYVEGTVIDLGKVYVYTLSTTVQNKMLFWGENLKKVRNMIPNKLGNDSLILVGAIGSETYKVSNTAFYQSADSTDYVWFKTDKTWRTVVDSEMIGYDYKRTFINYDDNTPYRIRSIGILKKNETLTIADSINIYKYFRLPVFHSGTLNAYGYVKNNRMAQNVWTAESVYEAEASALFTAFPTPATDGLKTAINTLIKGLKDAGYWTRIDCLEKYNMLAADQTPFNWKTATSIMTLGGTNMDFTTKVGYKGASGNTGYIKTGFIPSNGTNFTQNAATWMIGRTYSSANNFFDGVVPVSAYRLLLRGDGRYISINSNSDLSAIGAFPVGYNIIVRTSATTQRVYNGTWYAQTVSSNGRSASEVYLNCYNDGTNPQNIGINGFNTVVFGDKFTDGEADAIRVLLTAFDSEITAL